LLSYFEDKGFEKASRLFLLVSDFNIEAKKFYREMGYQEVGLIPDLIKKGVGEYLMMKSKEEMR
jgi:ribosomal protein S18 acetylase RimI-like enzyme